MIALMALLACGRCGNEDPCWIGDRDFYALPPADWDGSSPLPTVVFAHGYKGSASQYMDQEAVVSGFSEGGALLILPEAVDGAWSVNAGGDDQVDLDYISDVIEMAGERWPMDADHRVIGGFSIGASFTYVVACARPDLFTAANPISGGFWLPYPEACEGPISVNHEHGLNDGTWPMEGRELWEGATQGGAEQSFDLLLQASGCSEQSHEELIDTLTCTVYDDCADGEVLRMCTHDGKHERAAGWVQRLLDFAGI